MTAVPVCLRNCSSLTCSASVEKAISEFSCASVSKLVYVRNLSYENEFCMQFHFRANQSHIHKNVLHLDSLWNRGTRELGYGLLLLNLYVSRLAKKNSRHFFIQSDQLWLVQDQLWLVRTHFPALRVASATCYYFEFWLIHCIVCHLCDVLEWILWLWFNFTTYTHLKTALKQIHK